MYEKIGNTQVISCSACRAACIVGSDEAKMATPSGYRHGTEVWDAEPVPIQGRVYIVVRRGQSDGRWRRCVPDVDVDAEMPAWNGETRTVGRTPGSRVISVVEYPFLCEDCYETGGLKLDGTWERVPPPSPTVLRFVATRR